MYLQLLGYDAVIVKDVMWMLHTDKIVTKEDTVFILSVRIEQKNWQNLPELPSESALKSSPAAVRLLLIWNSILTLH